MKLQTGMEQGYDGTGVWWNGGMERRYGTSVVPDLFPDFIIWLAPSLYVYVLVYISVVRRYLLLGKTVGQTQIPKSPKKTSFRTEFICICFQQLIGLHISQRKHRKQYNYIYMCVCHCWVTVHGQIWLTAYGHSSHIRNPNRMGT